MLKHDALQLDYLVFHKPFRAAEMLKIDAAMRQREKGKANMLNTQPRVQSHRLCKENDISWNKRREEGK